MPSLSASTPCASTLKDVVAVGRDTYNLGGPDAGHHCIVNLGFLADYKPEPIPSKANLIE
jgi:hypothetical protein